MLSGSYPIDSGVISEFGFTPILCQSPGDVSRSRMTALDDLGLLTTPALADACMRLGVDVRSAPPGLRQLLPGTKAAGPVIPVRHAGSVDVFFEAYEQSRGGEVLVIDNEGRTDEGCIGDLTVIEAREAGLKGVVVWGCHRDTDDPSYTFRQHLREVGSEIEE